MANFSGAGSGALSGASLGASLGPWGALAGGAAGGLMGLFSKKKKSAPSWSPTPYTGARPPSIDSPGQEILRPTQKLDFDLTTRRAQGQDVGYDPSWMTSAAALTRSELGRAKDDRLRTQGGMLSAQGLSGNPRAYEATAGRTMRDYSTDLENSMNRLNVANMEASRADKNSATERLAALNKFNFNQEDTVADFDKSVWALENGFGGQAAGMDNSNYWLGQLDDQNTAEGQMGTANDLMKQLSPSVQALMGGKGIAPNQVGTTYNGQPVTGYRKDVNNKYLIK